MIENSGMQVSQLLCFLINTKLCVSSKFFFRHHLVCVVPALVSSSCTSLLGKSMQIPVGVACLFVCFCSVESRESLSSSAS